MYCTGIICIGKIQICVFYHNIPTLRGAGEKTKNFISPVFLYYLVKMLGHFFPRFFPRFFCSTESNSRSKKRSEGHIPFYCSNIKNNSRFGFLVQLAVQWHKFEHNRPSGYRDMVIFVLAGAAILCEIAKNGLVIARKPYVRLSWNLKFVFFWPK